jgi:Matrixin
MYYLIQFIVRALVKLLAFLLFLPPMTGIGIAEASPSNWSGRYAPCNRHSDLLNRQHMDLAVRISTSNVVLAQQFARAMEFWTEVLDLEWHEVDSQECAIQLVDGTPSLFNFCLCLSARSQFPDRPAFQGWIAFNPRLKLTKHEMFLDSVHEIGHLLGLPHNPDDSSVMFYFGLDKAASLDAADLDQLAARHQLRPRNSLPGGVKDVRVVMPRQNRKRG